MTRWLLPMEVDQEEIDQMTEDEKTRRLYEIDAEITILQRKRALVAAATAPAAVGGPTPPAVAPASLTPFQVDAANIQGL